MLWSYFFYFVNKVNNKIWVGYRWLHVIKVQVNSWNLMDRYELAHSIFSWWQSQILKILLPFAKVYVFSYHELKLVFLFVYDTFLAFKR